MSAKLAEFKQAAIVNSLRTCQLFAGPPSSNPEKIADISVIKSPGKGDYLFHEG